jgi:hypothetical protein
MHDSSNCEICRGQPVGGSMTDTAFFTFVDACRKEFAAKQARFVERIANAPDWNYELSDCSLTIGKQRFEVTVVGTFSAEYQTWLWGWANEDFPELAKERSRRIRDLADLTGFRVFSQPGIGASVDDAHDFAAMAIHQLDAIGLFRGSSKTPELFLAVHERLGS